MLSGAVMRLFVRFPVLDGHFLSMGEHVRKIRMIEIIFFCMKGLTGGPFLCRFLPRLFRSWWCFPCPCQAELRRLTIEAWYKPPCIGEHNTRLIVCKKRKRSLLGCHIHNALRVSCHLRNISQKSWPQNWTKLNSTWFSAHWYDSMLCLRKLGHDSNLLAPTLDTVVWALDSVPNLRPQTGTFI